MHFIKFHIGDYAKNTAHLSLLEHGVYRRLMDVYYAREEPIPEQNKYRCIGARTAEEKSAVDAVLEDFFIQKGSEWHLERCDEEIEKYRKRQQINRQNASGKRGIASDEVF